MNLLQISAPKSGSYWLYTILKQILQKKGLPLSSFIQRQPVYQQAKHWKLSFQEQAGIDMVDIEDEGLYYRISSAYRQPVFKPEEYATACSLAWTHSAFCSRSFDILPLFNKRIYIVRDPRDRALSAARFAFTPYMQQYYPSSYKSPEAYLQGEYERLLEQWMWHVGNYLLRQETLDIHFVFYERLLYNFQEELQSLLAYLNLPLSLQQQQDIKEAVSFTSMKESSPGHVQKGKYGKWTAKLSGRQKERAIEEVGPMLQLFSYPLEMESEEPLLPSLPAQGDRKALGQLLEQMNWQGLFV